MKKKILFFLICFFGVSVSFLFFLKSKALALDCGSCANIVNNDWCSGSGTVTCTGPNPPPWTRAETKCCRDGLVPTCSYDSYGWCDFYSYDGCQTCYYTYLYYSCTSDCYNQDCCSGGNIIAGHCETAPGASPACWFGNKYKVCCRPDGTEVPCSKTGDCPSQYNQQLCPAGSTITAPGVTTCAVVSTPTPTPPPGATPPPPTSPPSAKCTFSACGAYGCGSRQRWVSGDCWSYSWFGGDGCYNDDSCGDDNDCSGEFSLDVPDSICIEDGAKAEIIQHQESKFDTFHVEIDHIGGLILPDGVIVCEAEGCFAGACSCFWDTMHIENAHNYSDFNQNLPTGYPDPPGPYPTGAYRVSVYYSGKGDCDPQTVVHNTNLQYCPLPCPTSLSATCNADKTATFNWSKVEGAVSYTLRVNKEPFPTWTPVFVPPSSDGKGDFTANPTALSLTNKLEVGFWWEWSIHPIRAGEAYFAWQPNVCYAPPLLCPAILPTPTPLGNYTIAGRVTDVTKTIGIAGVQIEVWDWTISKGRNPVTDSNGYWSVSGLVKRGDLYKVRVTGNNVSPQTAPPGYLPPARTNEKGWNWDFDAGRDTPLGSLSYLYQIAGSNDCAGPNGLNVSERCSFSYDPSSPLPSPTPTFIPTPTPMPVPSWFQTTGGDIQSQGDITSIIPDCAASEYLSKRGEGESPGVVGYDGDLFIGTDGEVSETRWQAKTRYAGQNTGFEYLVNRLGVDRTNENLASGDLSSLIDGVVYYSSSSIDINDSFPGGKIVIFVDGDVSVADDIVVNPGDFFALIAKGNITFLGAEPDDVRKAQGFFLADGTIDVLPSTGNNKDFVGQGSFIGWEGINLARDLGPGNQNCSPAEAFIERPDFYINAPDSFKLTNSYFKEIEP